MRACVVVSITRGGFVRDDQAALASRTLGGSAMRAALNSGPMRPAAGVRRVISPPVLADRHVLEPIEVAQHIAPLGPEARHPAPLIQLLAQDERKKGAEHVAPDGGIG